jgi:hypothetical protein
MELLKIVRGRTGGYNPDDYIDRAAYAALAAEAHEAETIINQAPAPDLVAEAERIVENMFRDEATENRL